MLYKGCGPSPEYILQAYALPDTSFKSLNILSARKGIESLSQTKSF